MEQHGKTLGEQIHVAGQELLDTLKKLIEEGKVRRLIIWSEEGRKLLEIPLNPGVVIGGAAIMLAPFLVAIAGIAAVVKKVRVEVVRNDDPDQGDDSAE